MLNENVRKLTFDRLDDPLMWGVLPIRYMWNPDNLRWGLGSYDICFQNRVTSTFFTFGQLLPTHRRHYSSFGGPFQPTITQAIRLLSRGPFLEQTGPPVDLDKSHSPFDAPDPFSSSHLTYSTNFRDTFPAPSAYRLRRHAWVHVFPEGKIHQREDKAMRYFRWGVARLILESDPCPDLIPIWIEGFDDIMPEERTWPRFVPRFPRSITVLLGPKVNVDEVFGDLRSRWGKLYAQAAQKVPERRLDMGVLTDELKYGVEAVELRKECTMRVRQEVLKLRRRLGLPDEDPKARLVDTWREEGPNHEGKMDDGSSVKEG
jgi:monolysocardiolipin acyltransferase